MVLLAQALYEFKPAEDDTSHMDGFASGVEAVIQACRRSNPSFSVTHFLREAGLVYRQDGVHLRKG
jgi:hypothetical protein